MDPLQAAIYKSQGINRLSDTLRSMILRKLGQDFVAQGDFTPEGLQKFAVAKGLSPEDTKAMGSMIAQDMALKQGQDTLNTGRTTLGTVLQNPLNATINQAKGAGLTLDSLTKPKQGPKTLMEALASKITKDTPNEEIYEMNRNMQAPPKTPATAMAAFLQQNPNATPDEIAEYNQKLKSKMALSVGPDGSVSFEMGGGNLTPTTTSKTQGEVIDLTTRLKDLEAIKDTFKKDYLTYTGKFKGFALNELSKMNVDIGDKGREFIQGARVFKEGVEKVFNAYRKEITGAQAAMREIDMLRESILNKKLSPDEFESSYNNYISQIKRQLELKKKFLAQGLNEDQIGAEIEKDFLNKKTVQPTQGRFKIIGVK